MLWRCRSKLDFELSVVGLPLEKGTLEETHTHGVSGPSIALRRCTGGGRPGWWLADLLETCVRSAESSLPSLRMGSSDVDHPPPLPRSQTVCVDDRWSEEITLSNNKTATCS